MRKIYEPIFDKFHVDMHFSVIFIATNGRIQLKTVSVIKNRSDGTVYITVGDGGNRGSVIGFFDENPNGPQCARGV